MSKEAHATDAPIPNPELNRRSFLASAMAAPFALGASMQDQDRDYRQGANPVRYPDPDIIALDPSFKKYAIGNTPIQRVHTGLLWAEGTAWSGVGQFLVFSDIPNNIHKRLLWEDGHVSVYHNNSNYCNGNTFDYQGRQISCEHGTRRVTRYEANGKITVLADKFGGKKLNAPNDVVVHPDGGIWFTDPGYGSLMNYEGFKGDLEIKEAVYRIDDKTGKIEKVTDELFKPNGLCFSPDYKKLYIADTGASHYPEAKKIVKVFDVDGTKLKNGRTFCDMAMTVDGKEVSGMADGIRCDTDGNLWAAGGWVGKGYDGAHVFNPQGKRIGLILLPEICGNLCFGGPKRNKLYMAASQSIYAVYTEAIGAHIA